jgi:hypothetical protein
MDRVASVNRYTVPVGVLYAKKRTPTGALLVHTLGLHSPKVQLNVKFGARS